MPGIYYDPNLYAYGDAVGAGVDTYSRVKDNQVKELQRKMLYQQLAKEEAAAKGMEDIKARESSGLYSPQTTTQTAVQPTEEAPTYDPMGLASGTVAPPTETVQKTVTVAPQRSMLSDLKDLYIKTGNIDKAAQVAQLVTVEQTINSQNFERLAKSIHFLGQTEKDLKLDGGSLIKRIVPALINEDPWLKKTFGKVDLGDIKTRQPDDWTTILSLPQLKDYDVSIKIKPDGGIERTLKPKKDEAEPKGEFETFKAGTAMKPGETKEQWNERVAELWQDRKKEVAREGRSQPQQSQFVDPISGLPLIYDRATESYRVARVEGGGGVAPRPVNPSAGEREKTASFAVLSDQIKRIKDTYKPEFVGLVSGQLGRVTQLANKDEAAFRQVINDVKDSLLRARSGAQINEQEYARLAKLVPDYTDSETQFSGKMQSFETTLNTIMAERAKAQKSGGVMNRGTTPPLAAETPKFKILQVK